MFFEENISALRKVNPALAEALENQKIQSSGRVNEKVLEIVNTKSGMPSLKADNIALHSLYDPVKEAKAWVDYYEEKINSASSFVVLGFGLGYHVLELTRRTDKEIIIVEAELDILKKAFELLSLNSILQRIKIVTGDSIPYFEKDAAVLEYKPSVKLNPSLYAAAVSRLRSMAAIRKGLKILVVSPIYGGSLPIAYFCSSTLKKMGHDVELIDNSRFNDALFYAKSITKDKTRYCRLVDNLSAFLSEAVIARCEAFKPDLVFALAQAPLTVNCLERLKAHNIPTAYWFVEDFRLMEYWRGIAGLYNYFFTIQRGQFFEELKKLGVKNCHYLPLAASPEIHGKLELKDDEKVYYGSDISFVGAGYYNRRHLFKGLLDHDFKIWGTDWDMNSPLAKCVQRGGERIDTEETVKIFNASIININLHSSTYHTGINPYGDFVNPRTFEIAACGGFQLVDRRLELENLFEAGREAVVFENLEDLKDKIDYYLNNPEERHAVSEKARQRVLNAHTYEHRMKEMLETIACSGYEPPVWNKDGETVEGLIREAGEDTELANYLTRFSEMEKIKLSDIIEDVHKCEGDITRTETLFLLMNEFVK